MKDLFLLPDPRKRYGELRLSGEISPALMGTDYKSPHLVIEINNDNDIKNMLL